MTASERPPYILWLGPVLAPEDALAHAAVSPAGNGWQASLIAALSVRVPVVVVGHVPEPIWPRGRPFVGAARDGSANWRNERVRYLNVPAARAISLASAYRRAVRRHLERFGPPLVAIAYNDSAWNIAAAKLAARSRVPWLCVVADAPGEGRAIRRHEARINEAAGRVFLSYARYRDNSVPPALHLDGGVEGLRFDPGSPWAPQGRRRVVLYSGAMNRWAGATQLVEAFRHVRAPDVELWLCGHGRSPSVAGAAAGDGRIRLLGLLSTSDLAHAQSQADVFVNPRPPELADNRSNFPSKILDYLTWGRPVVSTWTEGLAPEYAPVLRVAHSAAPAELAAAIESALAMGDEERARLACSIGRFLTGSRLWPQQAARLLEWLVHEVGVKAPWQASLA